MRSIAQLSTLTTCNRLGMDECSVSRFFWHSNLIILLFAFFSNRQRTTLRWKNAIGFTRFKLNTALTNDTHTTPHSMMHPTLLLKLKVKLQIIKTRIHVTIINRPEGHKTLCSASVFWWLM